MSTSETAGHVIIARRLAAAAARAIAAVVLRRGHRRAGRRAPHTALLRSRRWTPRARMRPTTARDSSALRHLMISAFGVPAACGAEPAHRIRRSRTHASQIRTGTFTYSSTVDHRRRFHESCTARLRSQYRARRGRAPLRSLPYVDGPLITGVHLDSLIVSAEWSTAPLYLGQHGTTRSIRRAQSTPSSTRRSITHRDDRASRHESP